MSHYIVYDSAVLTHPEAVLDGKPLFLPVWCGGDNNVYEGSGSGRRVRKWTGYWVGTFDQVLIEMIDTHAAAACGGGLRRVKERDTDPAALIRSWRRKLQKPLVVYEYGRHSVWASLKFCVPVGSTLPDSVMALLERFPCRNEKQWYEEVEQTVWQIGLDEPENWIVAAQLRALGEQYQLRVEARGPRV
ncbi:hypothetical protein QU487_06720 [Crenobacter sp. SG2305]|uniref:hypothetical protein n=1 Tax=Crenobacter oryzisoli TaxID=3056844 RepID=UPI0025AA6F83|nr:hypothetical protein [Crenobacter sp. SG2305]MDN0082447.1 hypothetical protein [Crenobacter sp. SG2305]